MNQELQEYIRKAKEAGQSDEQIRENLSRAGWQEKDINSSRQSKINIKAMITKGILGIFVGLTVAFIVLAYIYSILLPEKEFNFTIFFALWVLIFLVFVIWGALSKTKEELQEQIVSYEGLTSGEKRFGSIFSFLYPILTGEVMYYKWRHKYPVKAEQINRISITVLLLITVLQFLYTLFTPISFPIKAISTIYIDSKIITLPLIVIFMVMLLISKRKEAKLKAPPEEPKGNNVETFKKETENQGTGEQADTKERLSFNKPEFLSMNDSTDRRASNVILLFFKIVSAIYVFLPIYFSFLGDLLPLSLANYLTDLLSLLVPIYTGLSLIFFLIPFFVGGIVGFRAIKMIEEKNSLGFYILTILICFGSVLMSIASWGAYYSRIDQWGLYASSSATQPLVTSLWTILYLILLFYLLYINRRVPNLGDKIKFILILIIIEILLIPLIGIDSYYSFLKKIQLLKQTQNISIQKQTAPTIILDTADWTAYAYTATQSEILPTIIFQYPPSLGSPSFISSRKTNRPEFISDDWGGFVEIGNPIKVRLEFYKRNKGASAFRDYVKNQTTLWDDIKFFIAGDGIQVARARFSSPDRYDADVSWYFLELPENMILVISVSGDKSLVYDDDKAGLSTRDKIITTLQLLP